VFKRVLLQDDLSSRGLSAPPGSSDGADENPEEADMKRIVVLALLATATAHTVHAGEIRTAESGFAVPVHPTSVDICKFGYFDVCSGWVYWWTGFNGVEWTDLEGMGRVPARVGVCFDLEECEGGCEGCRNLEAIVWAWRRFTPYGRIDVEIYSADENGCPLGGPIAGFYDYLLDMANAFHTFPFDGIELRSGECRFAALATVKTPAHSAPYSDANDYNREAPCEGQWRCAGHSYVYRSAIDYCAEYGHPAPLTVERDGACPPHDAFFSEWIVFAYVGCYGPTATEESTWSGMKKLYR
jgi:hypothetical protein